MADLVGRRQPDSDWRGSVRLVLRDHAQNKRSHHSCAVAAGRSHHHTGNRLKNRTELRGSVIDQKPTLEYGRPKRRIPLVWWIVIANIAVAVICFWFLMVWR